MPTQGELKDSDGAQSEVTAPANFDVSTDRGITAAISAGHRSKAEGRINVQAINAENVYVVASLDAAPPGPRIAVPAPAD